VDLQDNFLRESAPRKFPGNLDSRLGIVPERGQKAPDRPGRGECIREEEPRRSAVRGFGRAGQVLLYDLPDALGGEIRVVMDDDVTMADDRRSTAIRSILLMLYSSGETPR
jgi:hypothetical protein